VHERCDIAADLSTAEGRDDAVRQATERSGGSLAGIVTCAGLAGSPTRPGSLVASLNYFGTVTVLEGLRPLLTPGAGAVAISSNSTTVQPEIPADLVDACLADDEAAGPFRPIQRRSWRWRTGYGVTRPVPTGPAQASVSTPSHPA
jgi:hypothetical protein